jgi:hypothetical protein
MPNPYESPVAETRIRDSAPKPSRLLFWFSMMIVVFGGLIWLSLVASVAIAITNDWGGNPVVSAIVVLVFTLVLGLICIPQFFSVFCRSQKWASVSIWVSVLGVVAGLVAATVYPIAEYYLDNSPPGFEILGAISYALLAGLFFLNMRLHQKWIGQLEST